MPPPALLTRAPRGRRPPAGDPTLLRAARGLLDQQLWCCGRDIHHPDGNALLRYGFERRRPPAGEAGSSAYALALPDGRRCTLWGFAVLLEAPPLGAGLLLRRHPFVARLTDTDACADVAAGAHASGGALWRVDQLPRAGRTNECARGGLGLRLGAEAARALAEYERWALDALGADHRQRCEAERPRGVRRRQAVPCVAQADAWSELAERADALLAGG